MKQLILSGGLGNQMFEYAFYLSCKKRGIHIKLNRDLYEVNRMHNGYLLHRVFGVSDNEVTVCNRFTVLLTRILRRYHPLGLVYTEKPMTYSEEAFTTRKAFYDGCFIEPHYFEGIEEQVRNSFEFKYIDPHNINLGNKMLSEASVSLHIRRGDFLNNPIYNVCDERYYARAIDYINAKVNHPTYYVFSDDTEWSNQLMKKMGVDRYHIITWNKGADSYKDMYLMSQCKHNIIANSTFSWWGAWLNTNKSKMVVSPDKWTTTYKMNYSLPNWMFLEV